MKPLKFSWSIDRFSMTFTVDRNGKHYLSLVSDYLLFCVYYLRFRWNATLGNKTPAQTFPKFPSVLCVIDRSDRNPPITARYPWRKEGLKVTLVAVIGTFRSDLSITRKTDGNFGNVCATSFPGYSLYFEKVNLVPRVLSLLRESTLVTAGHVSARF